MRRFIKVLDGNTGNITAILLSSLIFVGSIQWQEWHSNKAEKEKLREYLDKPASYWLDIQAIRIPDFVEGEDPLMIYDVHRKVKVFGQWNVAIRPIGKVSNETRCNGQGKGTYRPDVKLPEEGVKFSWFMDRQCNLKAGQYIAEVVISFFPEERTIPKVEEAISNVFEVKPKE